MKVQPDFKDLLVLFNKHGVEYIIVGGYALAFHGAPRLTGDIDLYVHPSSTNAHRILAALSDFGFGGLDLSAKDFERPGMVVQLGYPPVRVDLITRITGVSWEEADAGKAAGQYGDVPVNFLGRQEYIANKRATARQKDLADLEALGEE